MDNRTNKNRWLVISILLAGSYCTVASGGTIYVKAGAGGANNGTSWADAYTLLQDGLDDAVSGDQIWIAAGTYYPTYDYGLGIGNRGKHFRMKNGVAIYGGFPATGDPGWEDRKPGANETILSGDIGTAGNNSDNCYHVFYHPGLNLDSTAILDGFTIKNGNATSSSPHNNGAGMYNNTSSPTVANCTFTYNCASDNGGGMLNTYFSSPTVTNCTFIDNSALNGAGMFNDHYSNPTVINCPFIGNSAGTHGGGMHNTDYSVPAVTNCTFTGNWCGNLGGGMFNAAHANLTVTNRTFSGNAAGSSGGGIANDTYSDIIVANCILWGNSASINPQIRNDEQSSAYVSYSDIQGGWGGAVGHNINANPLFVDADGADNQAGTADDDLRLQANSPCIDAGDNTAVPGGVTTDLDGNSRFVDRPTVIDTGNGTPPVVDMGAYEYQPPTIYVDAYAPGANDGASWEDAYHYLQDGLADAQGSGGDIWVAQGTYKPDANFANPSGSTDRTATFQLINGVALYGGYAGYWATEPDARDVEVYETILSGDINTPGDRSDNSYHVVTGSGTDANAVLDGFTITAGNANGSSPHNDGGGMLNLEYGSPTVTNCTFRGNSASDYGGGMSNTTWSSPTLSNCTFRGNLANNSGGAIRNRSDCSPTFESCRFIGNSAQVFGGGMYNSDSDPILSNCTFSSNSSYDDGGGMNNSGSAATLINCIFSGNIAGPIGRAGALENVNSSVTVLGCSFIGNFSATKGGAVRNISGGNSSFINCAFVGNEAADGGGMVNNNSSSTLTNCIFTGNSTDESGGGIWNRDAGRSTLTNCTFSLNTADANGGGMYLTCIFHRIFGVFV